MLKRPESELHIIKSRVPLPTVEVDIDCIPKELDGYGVLVTTAITPVVAKSQQMMSTIYVFQGPSINFQQPTWSVFFGVAGDKKLLDILFNAFKRANVSNVRYSDYLDPSTATIDFHVQDGYVWRPYESGTWYADSQDEPNLTEDAVNDSDDLEFSVSDNNRSASRTSSPSRFRIARADATVGTIREKIEEVFGLPEGSVALCGPDKKSLRGDATIATLRKRWE